MRSKSIGFLALAAAVLIWAGWLAAARGARLADEGTALSAFEIAVLRTAAPALLLAPVWAAPLWGSGPLLERMRDALAPPSAPWPTLLLMSAWGAPFIYCASYGLGSGDVALSAALIPGAMPLWAALAASVLTGARPAGLARIGLPLIALGAATALLPALDDASSIEAAAWFCAASICWALFAVAYPLSGLAPAHAAGLVGAYSVIMLGIAALIAPPAQNTFAAVSMGAVAWGLVAHGLLAGVVSVLAFAAALDRLGPAAAAASALVPGLAAAAGWAWVGDDVLWSDAAALLLASLGLLLTQLAALDRRRE